MARTVNPASAHRVKMAGRGRMSFGRTFLATLAAGKPHHDTAKVAAFVKASGFGSRKSADAESLNGVAIGIVALTPADRLPRNTAV